MAETANDTDDTAKRAIAPLEIIHDGRSAWNRGGNSSPGDSGGNSGMTSPLDYTGDASGAPPDGNDVQGPPAPPDGGGGYVDPCQDVASDSGNVNNTVVQSSSQSAYNTVSDDDVINVVQKIHGTYNGTGHLNTSISIDDSDKVSQSISQNVVQNAVIKKCPGSPGEGGIQTNTIDMNATQLASNAYSDNTVIVIVQTIIIPKDCNTNVDAPISISDRDTVSQSIDQGISQEGTIAYGGPGEGSNTVVQTSMQVATNNATNDEVITINQVIIVPPDCPAEVHAPIVVESNDDVQMSVEQSTEQNAAINSGAGGVEIVSSVSGSDQVTNTVVTTASQDGQNSFSDNDTITIQQNVYYVNDTSGWTEDNYEEYLAEEFGNETSGNSTSPAMSNSTTSEGGGGNSTFTEGPGNESALVAPAGENATASDSSNSTDDGTIEAASEEAAVEYSGGNETGEDPPSPDDAASVAAGQPVEQDAEGNYTGQPDGAGTPEQELPTSPDEGTGDVSPDGGSTDEQPPAGPPAPENAPPETNANGTADTAGSAGDPAPVDSQEADAPADNSTSTT